MWRFPRVEDRWSQFKKGGGRTGFCCWGFSVQKSQFQMETLINREGEGESIRDVSTPFPGFRYVPFLYPLLTLETTPPTSFVSTPCRHFILSYRTSRDPKVFPNGRKVSRLVFRSQDAYTEQPRRDTLALVPKSVWCSVGTRVFVVRERIKRDFEAQELFLYIPLYGFTRYTLETGDPVSTSIDQKLSFVNEMWWKLRIYRESEKHIWFLGTFVYGGLLANMNDLCTLFGLLCF